jgi:hypothetical protein
VYLLGSLTLDWIFTQGTYWLAWHWLNSQSVYCQISLTLNWIFTQCTDWLARHWLNIQSMYCRISWTFTQCTYWAAWHWTEYSLKVLIGYPDTDSISTLCTVGLAGNWIEYSLSVLNSFFLDQVYCARGTVPKLHITTTGRYGGESPRQALIKPDRNYESHVSPHSLPLSGGSSRGQVIPTCFKHAPQ